MPVPSTRTVALVGAAILLLLALDALVRTPSGIDYDLLRAVRSVEAPGIEPLLEAVRTLSSPLAVGITWMVVLGGLLAARRWLAAASLGAVPAAGVLAFAVSSLFGREAPVPGRIEEAIAGSGTGDGGLLALSVVLAVTLYGLLALVVAPQLPGRALRLVAGVATLLFVVLSGIAAAWLGQSWLTEVAAAYIVGGLVLLGAVRAYRAMAPTTSGLPLIHAVYLDRDGERAAHALTSTILFRGDTVWKIYAPGFVPRFFYWLAFQAPFAYSYNRTALDAAVHRRNLAGKLTEYWFGKNRVAPALGIEDYDGHPALVSAFVPGCEPHDHGAARAFLFDLAARFDAAGLPTWQIDPRQPRSLGNIMEGPDGEYTIIDLESGLVSPMASPRAWWRAVRRAQFPFYDDVVFDVTRHYVATEREQMRAQLGDAWLAGLDTLLDEAERTATAWHAGEPRIWSRLLRFVWSGFGLLTLRDWLRAKMAAGEAHATDWMEEAVDAWQREGRISSDEATRLRAMIESPDVQAVLPHFGVHLIIGVALRFPIGSITRATYVLGQLLLSTVRFGLRRIDRRTWRRDLGIHAPWVILMSAMPGIGTFAYLTSWPVLSRRVLIRVALDTVGEHLPLHVYRRSRLKRFIAHPVRHATAAVTPERTIEETP